MTSRINASALGECEGHSPLDVRGGCPASGLSFGVTAHAPASQPLAAAGVCPQLQRHVSLARTKAGAHWPGRMHCLAASGPAVDGGLCCEACLQCAMDALSDIKCCCTLSRLQPLPTAACTQLRPVHACVPARSLVILPACDPARSCGLYTLVINDGDVGGAYPLLVGGLADSTLPSL